MTPYDLSLCTALSLMLFFSFFFLIGKTPGKAVYDNYLRSRRTMGVALLVLSLNYAVHLFTGIRFISHNGAVLMNLSTYFLSYWLFSSALTTLLNRSYITLRRMLVHLSLWLLFTLLAGVVLVFLPAGWMQNAATAALATALFAYGIWLARRLILTYRKATRSFADIHSDNIKTYVNWMTVITYWAVIYGISCGLLTFLPDKWIFIWVLSSIPFYIYLYHSYYCYLMFYEQVERAIEIGEEPDSPAAGTDEDSKEGTDTPHYHEKIAGKLNQWIADKGYVQSGFTIQDLTKTIHTNRTYLNTYIRDTYHVSFCDWITGLRLEHAQALMKEHPELNIQKIAEASGFLSQSYFIKIFSEKVGCTPAKWRKQQQAH
ncbi:helix-turn-helix transcriptional regulator [uncultured Bacteroides sp.]|uniref:helix-turn-helix transcriptional regulator n=1 Tax=uncultured Bacteroides sp. TaxID=162156 RepID=UPI0026339A90|nr:helix-turn-helix transcriptional regulator [uncultured Bacteroides sp.]